MAKVPVCRNVLKITEPSDNVFVQVNAISPSLPSINIRWIQVKKNAYFFCLFVNPLSFYKSQSWLMLRF